MTVQEKEARLWARMPEFAWRVKEAKQIISKGLEQCSNPYVACSFGKDSSVMLDLVIQEFEDIPVRFIRWRNETELLADYDRVISLWEVNLTQVELSRSTLDDTRKERYETHEHDGYFIGFRADESKGRRITLRKDGTIYRMKNGKLRICPLAFWTQRDVEAYTYAYGLPVLDTYKAFGFSERTTSRVPREDYGIRSHSFRLLKEKDINKFNQLLQLFPDAKYFV